MLHFKDFGMCVAAIEPRWLSCYIMSWSFPSLLVLRCLSGWWEGFRGLRAIQSHRRAAPCVGALLASAHRCPHRDGLGCTRCQPQPHRLCGVGRKATACMEHHRRLLWFSEVTVTVANTGRVSSGLEVCFRRVLVLTRRRSGLQSRRCWWDPAAPRRPGPILARGGGNS